MNGQHSYLMFEGNEGSWNLWAIKFKGRARNVGYSKLLEPSNKDPMLTDHNFDEYKEMNSLGYVDLLMSMKKEDDAELVNQATSLNFPDGSL